MDTKGYNIEVALAVDHRREEVGESLLSLSTKTGIPRTTLRRRLAGHSPFNVQELAAVAAVLDTSVTQFLPADLAA